MSHYLILINKVSNIDVQHALRFDLKHYMTSQFKVFKYFFLSLMVTTL